NSAAFGLSVELNLDSLRHGPFSAHAQFQLEAYLPALAKNEAIIEIWTIQKEGASRPLSCRLSMAPWGDADPVIVVEGIIGSEIPPSVLPASLGWPNNQEDDRVGNSFYEQFFRTSSVPMLLIDPADEGRIVDANLAATRFYGYPPEEMHQKHTWEINTMGRDVLPVMHEVAKLPGGHKPLSFMHRLADGTTRHVQTYAGPVVLGGKRLMLGIIHDITEQKRLEQELQQAALQDPLTGLWNRRQFLHLVQNNHAQTQRYGQHYSLLLIDVDHFKHINDQYGHHKGDEVLILLARTLESRVRESDAVCRWGGEEFVILLPHTSLDDALLMADSLRETIEQICRPDFPHLTISIGVAQCQPGEDADALFKRVDEALYLAKASGRNKVKSGIG
ncbi:MAG: GGDEF domain-containing protein, partial [Betaproteobacteria bacterium]|nr:GGDEF domain-containing protein [Betaproteobacteria bacterium]